MFNGMSSWKGTPSRKSISSPASFGGFVPPRMPTNSSWRKHESVSTPVGASVGGGSAPTTSAGGLEPYDTTSGDAPLPDDPEKSCVYAVVQSSTTLTPFDRRSFQYACHPSVPYFAM